MEVEAVAVRGGVWLADQVQYLWCVGEQVGIEDDSVQKGAVVEIVLYCDQYWAVVLVAVAVAVAVGFEIVVVVVVVVVVE